MSFFKRKKDEPQVSPPTSGAYGSSSSYADDYGPDEYSNSAYGRSGGLQPGQPAGRGRSGARHALKVWRTSASMVGLNPAPSSAKREFSVTATSDQFPGSHERVEVASR